jgi:anthranilate 1,2-dioxygenase large subunit
MDANRRWSRKDYSRIPFNYYHDAAIYEREREKIFSGKTWSFLSLEAEIPNPGDFKTTFVGDIPILLSRDKRGEVHALVNRCAHRGAIVRREARGNASSHVCIYHRWCYGLDGRLTAVPLRKGVQGKGGMPEDFQMANHALTCLRVGSVNGMLFGTFSEQSEDLETYIGPAVLQQIRRIMCKPIRVLGYQRQRIQGNWKLYAENTRDNYHASLLHSFATVFGLDRATLKGGQSTDARHRHTFTYHVADSDSQDEAEAVYGESYGDSFKVHLHEPFFLNIRPERNDGLRGVVGSVFPNAVFSQSGNGMAVRQIRPKGPEAVEILFTLLGFVDDDEDMTARRLLAANMSGPAGYIAMEDGEAVEIVAAATMTQRDQESVVEMGGVGPIPENFPRATEISLRGFWSYYAELMEIEPDGAFR